MTDATPSTPIPTGPKAPTRGRGRRFLGLAAVAVVAGLAGAFATKAVSQGFGHHGFHRMGGFMGGPMDAADAASRAERIVKHFAVEVDATDAQRDKLVTLAKAAAAELMPMREKMRAARGQGIKILGAPTVDRAALEALRAEQVANGEAMSKRMTQLMADAAEVLTPEQRQKVAERMEKRRERWGRWHDRGDRGLHGDKGEKK